MWGKCFHNLQEAENTFQEFVKFWNMDIYGTEKKKKKERKENISHWQNVLLVIVPIFINKDVFESSYSDLKFTV